MSDENYTQDQSGSNGATGTPQNSQENENSSQNYGSQNGNQNYGPQNGNQNYGPQNGNPNYGPQNGNPNYGPQNGNPNYGPQNGNRNYGSQGGNRNYGPQNGGWNYGPQNGGWNYGPQNENPNYGPQNRNPNYGPQHFGPMSGAMNNGSEPEKRHHAGGAGKHVGMSVLSGVIIGVVASIILVITSAIAIPKIVNEAVSDAGDTIQKDIEDIFSGSGSDSDSGFPFGSFTPGSGDSGKGGNDGGENLTPDSGSSDSDKAQANTNSAFLGIYGTDPDKAEDKEKDVDYPDGAYITDVISGSPADLGGLESGEVITAVDGKEISGFQELRSIIGEHEPGDKLVLTVKKYSNGEFKESTHDVTLTEMPSTQQSTN